MLPGLPGLCFAAGVAAEACIGPDPVTGWEGGRREVGGDGDAIGVGETGFLGASKTTADATRCYIPSEIFKLPDYAGENG